MTKKNLFKKSQTCLVCGSLDLVKYLSLGNQAPANAYITKAQLLKSENRFPLEVYFCKNCYLAQLLHRVDRKLLFSDYAYFSSTSPMLVKHFEEYAEKVFKRFPKQAKKLTVDIGSNDGVLLKPFKKFGANILGIDPATNIAKEANKNGIPTITDFFNSKIVPNLVKKYGKAGIITSNNTLAHTDVVHDIFDGIKKFLDDDGVFVFEVQYVGDLIEHNEFDNTYHEHICYYSLWPIIQLLRFHSLDIFHVERYDTHGGSVVVYASHPFVYPIEKSVIDLLTREKNQELYKIETYKKFSKKPEKVKKNLVKMLQDYKKQGKKIVGYGASAKCTTLLQYCDLGPDTIDYITDSAPSKQGKYTPGTHIPIVSPEQLKNDTPDVIVLFAWNYANNIIEKEKWFTEGGGVFIIPIPEPTIVNKVL